MIWLPENRDAILQLAVGVSSRNFKKATERNRVKRLMRETYRLQKQELYSVLKQRDSKLSLFIIYLGKDVPAYETVYEKMGSILNRLIKMTDEHDQKNT